MNDGYQQARERRGALERLTDKIPGFRGYQDRELRRDVDRLQREHLARQVEALKGVARERASAYTDRGRLEELTLFDRLDRRLDGLAQKLRFADYGYSGLFDAIKILDDELEKLYRFDLSMIDELTLLASDVAAIPPPGDTPGGDSPAPPDPLRAALDQALTRLATVEEKWASRGEVISEIVKSSPQG